MGISSLFLGLGIVYEWRLVSVIASLAFVAGFSFGLGPIPFLIIPELVDSEGVSAGQSFGLVTNWFATFCVVSLLIHTPLVQWTFGLDANHGVGLLFPDFEWMVGWICILIVRGYRSVFLYYGLGVDP